MKEKVRFTEIDGLRFLAACSVLLFHYTFRGVVTGSMPAVGPAFLAPVFKYGYFGVDLFFMISGFVILMSAMGRSAKSFVVSRLVRIYPAFWFACTLTFVLMRLWGHERFIVAPAGYVLNLTMLADLFHVKSVDGVYWSLLYEVRFYVLVFLLIIGGQMKNIKWFLGAWLAVSIVLLQFPSKIGVIVMPEYSAYFISGAVFYLVFREGTDPYKLILLAASFVLALARGLEKARDYTAIYHADFHSSTVAALITGMYLVFLLVSLNKTAFLRNEAFVFWGALTYPLYLIHQFIGFMLFNLLAGRLPPALLFAAVILFMLAGAYLIHAFIEEKAGPLFKRFLERRMV